MYGVSPAAPIVTIGASIGAITLPSTGGNFVVSLALSVAAGLVTWGAIYARSNR